MQRRTFFLAVLCTLAVAALVGATTASAGVHYVTSPYCEQTSLNTISCSGKLAGLGNGPIYVVTNTDAGCTNQDGSHVIPGHSTTVSGPFPSTNGNFAFGAEDNSDTNVVTASGPARCPGNNTPFVSTTGLTLTIYECTPGGGGPTFSKKTGAQTNLNCTLVIGPTSPTIIV